MSLENHVKIMYFKFSSVSHLSRIKYIAKKLIWSIKDKENMIQTDPLHSKKKIKNVISG